MNVKILRNKVVNCVLGCAYLVELEQLNATITKKSWQNVSAHFSIWLVDHELASWCVLSIQVNHRWIWLAQLVIKVLFGLLLVVWLRIDARSIILTRLDIWNVFSWGFIEHLWLINLILIRIIFLVHLCDKFLCQQRVPIVVVLLQHKNIFIINY